MEKKDTCTPVEYYILTCTTIAKNINTLSWWAKNVLKHYQTINVFVDEPIYIRIPANTIIKNILFFDYIELYVFNKLLKKDIMLDKASSDMYNVKLVPNYLDSKNMFYNTLINDLDISNKNKKLLGKDIRDNLGFFFKDPESVNEIGNIFEWDFYIAGSNILEDNFIIIK